MTERFKVGGRARHIASWLFWAVAIASVAGGAASADVTQGNSLSEGVPSVRTGADGTVEMQKLSVPLSIYMSNEAKAVYLRLSKTLTSLTPGDEQQVSAAVGDLVDSMKKAFPATVKTESYGGVKTLVVTPSSGIASRNRNRVLINLHGGGSTVPPPEMNQLLESLPIAAASRMKIISISFGVAPEHKFPDANRQVARVYAELIKHYPPKNIGIFGCSFGGILTAEMIAWFQENRLPQPGAIGIFCAGGEYPYGGDSAFWAPPLFANGSPPPPTPNPPTYSSSDAYFSGANFDSALVSPARHPEVSARFPPTLIVTGTRDFMLSSAVHTHAALLQAGASSQLEVAEGMWHAYMYSAHMPESKQMYALAAKFFDDHLGK